MYFFVVRKRERKDGDKSRVSFRGPWEMTLDVNHGPEEWPEQR